MPPTFSDTYTRFTRPARCSRSSPGEHSKPSKPLLKEMHRLPASNSIKDKRSCMCYYTFTPFTPQTLSERLQTCTLLPILQCRLLRTQANLRCRCTRKYSSHRPSSHRLSVTWNNLSLSLSLSLFLSVFAKHVHRLCILVLLHARNFFVALNAIKCLFCFLLLVPNVRLYACFKFNVEAYFVLDYKLLWANAVG